MEMQKFEEEYIEGEDEIHIQDEETGFEINTNDIQDDSNDSSSLLGPSTEPDITLSLVGFTTYEIETIKRCDDIHLRNALILNRKKKYLLLKTLNRLKLHQREIQDQRLKCKHLSVKDADWCKKNSKFRLGMPYFKDSEMYSSPYNEDYYTMQSNNELPQQSYIIPRPWTPIDKCKLALAVYKTICNEKENELKKQIEILSSYSDHSEDSELEVLQKELKYLKNKEIIYNIATKWNSAKVMSNEEVIQRKNELRTNISYLQSEIVESTNTTSKNELLGKVKKCEEELNDVDIKNYIITVISTWNKKIDWLYISCNEVERHNDVECSFMWHSYMNPINNKKPWTDEQNELLIKVAQKHKMNDWQKIADELNLNKSAYQCCIHFFSKIWDKCRRTKWSREEEIYLRSLINMFKISDYIPWSKIAKYFTERSKMQIYKHYVSCMMSENCRKGVFTLAEDILLCSLLSYYNSITKASYYFPNRTLIQLRDRYSSMGNNLRDWTFEDDVNILIHVEKYGEVNWKIANVDKHPDTIRHRYQVLKKWIMEHPGENIQNVRRRKKSTALQTKKLENQRILERMVSQLMEEVNSGENPEAVFNMGYIEQLLKQTGHANYDKNIKSNRKKTRPHNFSYFITEFLKYYHSFTGRQKTWADFDSVKSAERIDEILKTLGANLNIPDINALQNNKLLDEVDIKILTELSKSNQSTSEPAPSTSKVETTVVRACGSCIAPDPGTLIGFRGVLLHTPLLKNNAANYYHAINRYLPDDSYFDVSQCGMKYTSNIMLSQIQKLADKDRVKIINNCELFEKRFKSVFKWPAIMSLPSNPPPENVFSGTIGDKGKEIKPLVAKKPGRPAKVSVKVQRMLEAKKRKQYVSGEGSSTEKKSKIDD